MFACIVISTLVRYGLKKLMSKSCQCNTKQTRVLAEMGGHELAIRIKTYMRLVSLSMVASLF